VQYCHEELIGSYIPSDMGIAPSPTPSGATQRALALGKTLGYDLNFYDLTPALKLHPEIKTLCIDEVQNFPRCVLRILCDKRFRIHVAGDPNQGFLDPRSNLESIRQYFLTNKTQVVEHVFTQSYRISQKVAEVMTRFLAFQDMHCTRIGDDKTTERDIKSVPDARVGQALYHDILNEGEISAYKTLCQDTNYAIVVPEASQIEAVQYLFGTRLVFIVEEISGGEYKNVILYNLFEKIDQALNKALQKQKKNHKTKTTRVKDKCDTTGEEMVSLFREAYVALSRAREKIIIFYNTQHEHASQLVHYLKHGVTIGSEKKPTESPSPVSLHLPDPLGMETEEETKVEPEKYHTQWVLECNKFIKRALEPSMGPNARKRFLNIAKGILKDKHLNPKDIELPDNAQLPEGYECFFVSNLESKLKRKPKSALILSKENSQTSNH